MNDLELYFKNNKSQQINKWEHYFEIYNRHFNKYREQELVVVEIGVFQGGSLQMWKHYFGPKVKIYGLDINPMCKQFEEENIKIFIGSQSDRAFLKKVASEIGPIDILIDDGGHSMKQQITSFQEFFKHVKYGGVYLCEDTHTSYWLEFGGGYKRRGTFMEFSKNLIDQLNAFHSQQHSLQPTSFTSSTHSIHFYDSIVVIEKIERQKPKEVTTGLSSFEKGKDRTRKTIKYKILFLLNWLLRSVNLPSLKW